MKLYLNTIVGNPTNKTKNRKYGKTCGRGQKGQKSRSGYSARKMFEGGQTNLARRVPKFGFTPLLNKKESIPLYRLNYLETRLVEFNLADLKQAQIISRATKQVKIFNKGILSGERVAIGDDILYSKSLLKILGGNK